MINIQKLKSSCCIIVFIFMSLICILSCNIKINENGNDHQIITQSNDTLYYHEESFEDFYIRFFKDTAFQMSRIVFPLAGLEFPFPWTHEWEIDNISDTVLDYCYIKNHEFFWTKNKWGYFHPLEDTVYFEEVFRKNTDTLKGVEFRGKKVNGEIDEIHVFLDFKKKCGKWFLIYYESTDL